MFLKAYILTLPILAALDTLWLGVVAKTFYKNQASSLMKAEINWFAGVAFYLIFAVGLTVFVILPSVGNESLRHALLLGALFGLVAYAAYDLTNLATLKDWSLALTIVDMAWGAAIAALTSVAATFVLRI